MARTERTIEDAAFIAPPIGDAEIAVVTRLEKYLAALAAYETAYKTLIMCEEATDHQFAQQLVKSYGSCLREARRVALAIRKMARAEDHRLKHDTE